MLFQQKTMRYKKLQWETLQQRFWYGKLYCFNKIIKAESQNYLNSIIVTHNMSYTTRQCNKTLLIKVKHNFFKNAVFPSAMNEWNI